MTQSDSQRPVPPSATRKLKGRKRTQRDSMPGSLKKFAEALALGQSAVEASRTAGYPRGKSKKTYAANARKRAGSKRVKKIGAELLKPAKEKLQRIIEANSVGDRAAA